METSQFIAGRVAPVATRNTWQSIKRGMFGRCPNCGEGKIFYAYLKVNDACPHCGEDLHHQRADDAPPYITMLIVGHVVLAMLLLVDERWPALPMLVHIILWPSLALGLSLWLLPIVKGGLIGLQWALRMHGFGDEPAPVAGL